MKQAAGHPAAPQGRAAASGQGEASVAPDSAARWSSYCSQGHFKTELFRIHVADHECTQTSAEQVSFQDTQCIQDDQGM